MPQLGLRRSKEDCTRLTLRERRNHDARRTMISLARAGGASKDLLEWVTHGPPGDVIDGYTTLPWETLCQQVPCIKIERREGKLLALPVAAGGGHNTATFEDRRAQVCAQVGIAARADSGILVGCTGFGNVWKTSGQIRSRAPKTGSPTANGVRRRQSIRLRFGEVGEACAPVGTRATEVVRVIASMLERARIRWLRSGDGLALRRALLVIARLTAF